MVSVCGIVSAADNSAGESKNQKVQLEEPKSASVDKEIKELPDGILKVKTNPDGSFKSLIVKATAEIEDALGAQKAKRFGRKEAEIGQLPDNYLGHRSSRELLWSAPSAHPYHLGGRHELGRYLGYFHGNQCAHREY